MSVKIDSNHSSWVQVDPNSDFPIQNLPFGTFKTDSLSPRVGIAIGDKIVDLKALFVLGYLQNLPFHIEDFDSEHLNTMMLRGKGPVAELRLRIYKLLLSNFPDLRDHENHAAQTLVDQEEATMLLPIKVGDYTDFYSSEQHAYNEGCLFRDPDNPL